MAITTTLGAGSVTSPYFFEARITKQLCAKTAVTPVFTPVFTLVSYTAVGATQYEAIVNVQGIVSYTPCKSCCAKAQTINENFVLPFYSASAPSVVSVAGGTPRNSLLTTGCCNCSNSFLCDVPVSLTITSA